LRRQFGLWQEPGEAPQQELGRMRANLEAASDQIESLQRALEAANAALSIAVMRAQTRSRSQSQASPNRSPQRGTPRLPGSRSQSPAQLAPSPLAFVPEQEQPGASQWDQERAQIEWEAQRLSLLQRQAQADQQRRLLEQQLQEQQALLVLEQQREAEGADAADDDAMDGAVAAADAAAAAADSALAREELVCLRAEVARLAQRETAALAEADRARTESRTLTESVIAAIRALRRHTAALAAPAAAPLAPVPASVAAPDAVTESPEEATMEEKIGVALSAEASAEPTEAIPVSVETNEAVGDAAAAPGPEAPEEDSPAAAHSPPKADGGAVNAEASAEADAEATHAQSEEAPASDDTAAPAADTDAQTESSTETASEPLAAPTAATPVPDTPADDDASAALFFLAAPALADTMSQALDAFAAALAEEQAVRSATESSLRTELTATEAMLSGAESRIGDLLGGLETALGENEALEIDLYATRMELEHTKRELEAVDAALTNLRQERLPATLSEPRMQVGLLQTRVAALEAELRLANSKITAFSLMEQKQEDDLRVQRAHMAALLSPGAAGSANPAGGAMGLNASWTRDGGRTPGAQSNAGVEMMWANVDRILRTLDLSNAELSGISTGLENDSAFLASTVAEAQQLLQNAKRDAGRASTVASGIRGVAGSSMGGMSASTRSTGLGSSFGASSTSGGYAYSGVGAAVVASNISQAAGDVLLSIASTSGSVNVSLSLLQKAQAILTQRQSLAQTQTGIVRGIHDCVSQIKATILQQLNQQLAASPTQRQQRAYLQGSSSMSSVADSRYGILRQDLTSATARQTSASSPGGRSGPVHFGSPTGYSAQSPVRSFNAMGPMSSPSPFAAGTDPIPSISLLSPSPGRAAAGDAFLSARGSTSPHIAIAGIDKVLASIDSAKAFIRERIETKARTDSAFRGMLPDVIVPLTTRAASVGGVAIYSAPTGSLTSALRSLAPPTPAETATMRNAIAASVASVTVRETPAQTAAVPTPGKERRVPPPRPTGTAA
jgi:hypothetical protein